MGTDITIRGAKLQDADQMFLLVSRFATSFTPEAGAFRASLARLLQDDHAWVGLAELNGEIVGYCLGFDHYTFYANGRVSWVEEIMVREELRRKAIGKTLMSAFEAWARSRGSKLIGLATRRAADFYQALGFEQSATYFRKLLG